jgi:PEGA domain
MSPTRIITGLVLITTLAAPALADDGQHRRRGSDRHQDERTANQAPPPAAERRERAVPRFNDVQPRSEVRRDRDGDRWRGYDARQNYNRSQVYRSWNRAYRRPTIIVPRVISPRIVTVVPYRPYVYRPSFSLGVFYGANGYYPYGYTPRAYYDPIPGVAYGGVRITGAPRDAQVFADGYYVGIVDDFDGIFQHINLEAGPHHVEIDEPGFEPIAFDVMVQPGQTVMFRADMIRY